MVLVSLFSFLFQFLNHRLWTWLLFFFFILFYCFMYPCSTLQWEATVQTVFRDWTLQKTAQRKYFQCNVLFGKTIAFWNRLLSEVNDELLQASRPCSAEKSASSGSHLLLKSKTAVNVSSDKGIILLLWEWLGSELPVSCNDQNFLPHAQARFPVVIWESFLQRRPEGVRAVAKILGHEAGRRG